MNFTAETKAAGRDIRLPGKQQPLCIYSRMGGGRLRASAGRGVKVMAIHSARRTAPVVRARYGTRSYATNPPIGATPSLPGKISVASARSPTRR